MENKEYRGFKYFVYQDSEGYIHIPKGHSLYRVNSVKEDQKFSIFKIPGGIAFSGWGKKTNWKKKGWWIGFKCDSHDRNYIEAKCKSLIRQIIDIYSTRAGRYKEIARRIFIKAKKIGLKKEVLPTAFLMKEDPKKKPKIIINSLNLTFYEKPEWNNVIKKWVEILGAEAVFFVGGGQGMDRRTNKKIKGVFGLLEIAGKAPLFYRTEQTQHKFKKTIIMEGKRIGGIGGFFKPILVPE